MKIEELQAVEFPHAAIISEYKINVKKLPVPLKAKVQNVNKAIAALTDESTEEEIQAVLDESTLVAGVLIEEQVPKEAKPDAKEIVKESTVEVKDTIEEIDEEEETEEEEEVEEPVKEEKKPAKGKTEPKALSAEEKVAKIVAICKEKGSITMDQLKEFGMKNFADSIELNKDNTIEKKGEVYVLKTDDKKGDGVLGTILAIGGAIGLVFGLHKLFGKK